MKKASLAVAALLTSLSTLSVIPAAYAEDNAPTTLINAVPPINADGQPGATLCDECESSSCLCNTPNAPSDNEASGSHTSDGTPPTTPDGQLGATVCEGCNTSSCLCGDTSTDTNVTPDSSADNNSTSSNDGDTMDSSSNTNN